jgi:hypothetical protein
MTYTPPALKRSDNANKVVEHMKAYQDAKTAAEKENKLRQIKNGKIDDSGNPIAKVINPKSRDWHGSSLEDLEKEYEELDKIKPLTKNQRAAVERGNNKGNALDNLLNKINNYEDEAAVDTIAKAKLTNKKPVNFTDDMILSQQHYDDIMEELNMERTSLKKQIQFLEQSPELTVAQHSSWDSLNTQLKKLEEDINVVKKHKTESDEYAKSKLQDKINSYYKEGKDTGDLPETKGAYTFDTPYGRVIVDASAKPEDVNSILDRYFENPSNITTNTTAHIVNSDKRLAYIVTNDGNHIYVSSAMHGEPGWNLGIDDMSIGKDAVIHEGAHVAQESVNPNQVQRTMIKFRDVVSNMSLDE